MQRLANWQQLRVHPIFPHVYLETAAARGALPGDLLQRAGIEPPSSNLSSLNLNMEQMNRLVGVVIESTGNHGIGIEVGQLIPPTAFGSLGFAIVCSETIEEAVKTALRFWNLAAQHLRVELNIDQTWCTIGLSSLIDLADPFQQLIIESAMAVFKRGLELLSFATAEDSEIWFSAKEPGYAGVARQALGKVSYAMPSNCFRFRATLLAIKLPMRNPSGFKLACQQCEREEADLDWPDLPLIDRIQSALQLGDEGYPDLETISTKLGMTSRTLRRHLDAENTRFATLLEARKQQDAVSLLNQSSLSIQAIASRLGYQDPANFTRAFRQWTGQTPSQFRQGGK